MTKGGIFLLAERYRFFLLIREITDELYDCPLLWIFYQVDEPDYAYFCSRNTK